MQLDENIYNNIHTQLKSSERAEPLKVVNGYNISTLIPVAERLLEEKKDEILKDEMYLYNYLNFVSFVMGIRKLLAEKDSEMKTNFSRKFYSELLLLLDARTDANG